MALTDVGMATDGVVLVGDPDDEDDVERRRRVVEELRHDRLHPWGSIRFEYTQQNFFFLAMSGQKFLTVNERKPPRSPKMSLHPREVNKGPRP